MYTKLHVTFYGLTDKKYDKNKEEHKIAPKEQKSDQQETVKFLLFLFLSGIFIINVWSLSRCKGQALDTPRRKWFTSSKSQVSYII